MDAFFISRSSTSPAYGRCPSAGGKKLASSINLSCHFPGGTGASPRKEFTLLISRRVPLRPWHSSNSPPTKSFLSGLSPTGPSSDCQYPPMVSPSCTLKTNTRNPISCWLRIFVRRHKSAWHFLTVNLSHNNLQFFCLRNSMFHIG